MDKTFEIEIEYTIKAFQKVKVKASSYKAALRKFKKEHGIEEDENYFDGMATGPELDLDQCIDSIDAEIWDEE